MLQSSDSQAICREEGVRAPYDNVREREHSISWCIHLRSSYELNPLRAGSRGAGVPEHASELVLTVSRLGGVLDGAGISCSLPCWGQCLTHARSLTYEMSSVMEA